jgi:hypothetical protein
MASSITPSEEIIDIVKITNTVDSEQSSSNNSPRDLSPVVENLSLTLENHEEDDIDQIESRSQSAEPPRRTHLSGQSDKLASRLPPATRRQVELR